MIKIIPGLPEHQAAFERLALEVFGDLGQFGQLLGKFYATQGVHTFLAQDSPTPAPVGFAIVGFLPWAAGDDDRDWWLADLLALGVAEERRRQGIGRRLMEQVFDLIRQMAEWRDLRACQLTCPAAATAARAFFAAQGFETIDENHGVFADGQPAVRLGRDLRSILPQG